MRRAIISAAAIAVTGLLAASDALAFADVSGHWQVSMDCGYHATATSFLNLASDVVTGNITGLAPDGCGTIELPTSIEKMTSCDAPAGTVIGRITFSGFDIPASAGLVTNTVAFSPFFYPLLGCTVAEISVDSHWHGSTTADGSGLATRVHGTVTNGYIEFRRSDGTICYSYPDAPDCSFEMLRNDVAPGSGVSVEPRAGTMVTFDTVTGAGTVAVMPLTHPDASVPGNFQIFAPGASVPIFYDVSTTATVAGPITTCFDYPDTNDDGVVDGTDPWLFETDLQILHEEDGTFVDRTSALDTTANVVCAETTSFSQVAVGSPAGGDVPWQDHSLANAKLVVKRAPSGIEKVVFVSKDPAFLFPAQYTVNSPTTSGISIELFAHGEGAVETTVHSSALWKTDPGRSYATQYVEGTFRQAKLVAGRALKVKLTGTDLALNVPQGAMGARVTTGLLRNCALFAGAGVFRDLPGRFVGKIRDAASLADCSDAALGLPGSPNGAFLDQ